MHSSTTGTEDASGHPEPLPGWSSVRLQIWGTWIRWLSALLVFPLAAESAFGAWYGITLLVLLLGGTAYGYGVETWAERKAKREISRGYTSYVEIAAKQSELFWTDPHLRRFHPPGSASKAIGRDSASERSRAKRIPADPPAPARLRRCVVSGCPAYFVQVLDPVCRSCGNRTQYVPGGLEISGGPAS